MTDQTLTWNIKDIKLKLQQVLSNNLSNHNSYREDIMQILSIRGISTPKGSILTLPQKSTCYLLVFENSMPNYSFPFNLVLF